MRKRTYVYPIKINLDRDTASALHVLHEESGWPKNQMVRIGLRMFITEYKRLGIGKGLGGLRLKSVVDPI